MSHMSERVDLTLTEKLGLNDAYIPRIDVPVSEVTLWCGDERDIPSARYFGRVSTRAGEEKIVTAEVVVPVRDERLRGALGRDALHVASLTAEGVVFLDGSETSFGYATYNSDGSANILHKAVKIGRDYQPTLPSWVSRDHCVVEDDSGTLGRYTFHVEDHSTFGTSVLVPDVSRNTLPHGDFRDREAVRRISAAVAERPLHGEDAYCLDNERKIFGVFDGVGGSANGARASQFAARAVPVYANRLLGPNATRQPLKEALVWNRQVLNKISMTIAKEPTAGYSTATLARVVEQDDGRKFLAYASMGDSRLYLVRDDKACQLTRDDGEGSVISAALGNSGKAGQISMETPWRIGYKEIFAGDTVLIGTDGIWGDYLTDVMSDGEISMLIKSMHDRGIREPESIAQALLNRSRKNDDKTLVAVSCL